MLRHDPHAVIHDLEKATADAEAPGGSSLPDDQRAGPEERHERGVARQDADLPIERRSDYGIGFAVKHRRFGRNHRDMHHELASFCAFSTASSIPPTM